MHSFRVGLVTATAVLLLCTPASAEPLKPLRFFEGRTESQGIIRLFMKKPYKSRSFGRGVIEPDGSLLLVQRVEDEGKPARMRAFGPDWYALELERMPPAAAPRPTDARRTPPHRRHVLGSSPLADPERGDRSPRSPTASRRRARPR